MSPPQNVINMNYLLFEMQLCRGFRPSPKKAKFRKPPFYKDEITYSVHGLKKAKKAGRVRDLRILCESPLFGQIESGLEGGIYGGGIGLAPRLFHHLTDEPGGELGLGLHLFHLVGIG